MTSRHGPVPARPLPRIGVPSSTMSAEEAKGVARQQVPEPYVRRVEEAGGLPVILPVATADRADDYLDLVDGLLLIGGDDVDPDLYGAAHPALCEGVVRARDDFEIALVRKALARRMPVLGICRGLQILNVALGGTLVEDIPFRLPEATRHRLGIFGPMHPVEVVPGSRLHEVVGSTRLEVNSQHHQSVDRVAPDLVVTARAEDGVVEGAETKDGAFCLAVQWHPERMAGVQSTARLFGGFLAAVRGRLAEVSASRPGRADGSRDRG